MLERKKLEEYWRHDKWEINAYFSIFVVDLYVTGRRGVVKSRHNADDLIWMVFRVCSRTVAKRPGTASPNKKADRLSGCELVRQRVVWKLGGYVFHCFRS